MKPYSALGPDFHQLPGDKPIFLDNVTCVYCSTTLDEQATKEHVIGRRFVPKGKLESQWNLIVRACLRCNQKKSDLEDDLSAISMQPDLHGRHVTDDQDLKAESTRKAQNSMSRRTKKSVKESFEQVTLKMPKAAGVKTEFSIFAPPQADENRIFELARLHIMAFFYWATYNSDTKKGRFWLGGFNPIHEVSRLDWGNPVHQAFSAMVLGWEPRIFASGADGYFKVMIRRHPNELCWSWALEWNKNFRIVGFFGEQTVIEELTKSLPTLKVSKVVLENGGMFLIQKDVSISEDEDVLFFWNSTSLV